ncbi:hypothetical protein Vretimale_8865 [Volvox reticuliferus]|uniref:Uncharacterized protein n=1 Tax=Volvox reticuliferus TaxID=1737510 RepID=A0A8J4LPE0_9CHLO|nr:hypothetical protein Vretimale_8865 [Volvox reticuliferus]
MSSGGSWRPSRCRRIGVAWWRDANWHSRQSAFGGSSLPDNPDRYGQAARRIQAAFRNVVRARRSVNALASVASASLAAASTTGAAGSGLSPSRPSPGALRQSAASVLLGSPPMQGSPASPNYGRGGGEGAAAGSPPRKSPGVDATGAAQRARTSMMMGPRRYKELHAQVEGKLNAYVALAKSRGSRRPDPRVAEARLAQLLGMYNRTATERLAAVAERQRNLVAMDTLCAQLDQVGGNSKNWKGTSSASYVRT